MQLRNRRGTPVDPVPFLVVVGMAFLFAFTLGPGYCLALGLGIHGALAGSLAAFAVAVAGAYYRLVWTARPDLRGEIPGTVRLQRLVYAVLLFGLLILGLSLPML
ncbi:MAG: hypothetical protein ABEJ28_04340 [Salinigranum sp.]